MTRGLCLRFYCNSLNSDFKMRKVLWRGEPTKVILNAVGAKWYFGIMKFPIIAMDWTHLQKEFENAAASQTRILG